MSAVPFDATEILNRYEANRCLKKGQATLDLDADERGWLLRAHYLPEPKGAFIDDEDDIADRANVDAILGLVSVLEVISIATGMTPRLDPAIVERLAAFLINAQVRRYYEQFYPQALPTLFRLRLLGSLPSEYERLMESTAQSSLKVLTCLISFFELDSRIGKNKDLEFFLDLLDDYTSEDGEIDLYDILDLLKNRKAFEAYFVRARTGSAEERRGVRGLCEFIRFADDYYALLQRMEQQPLLRSAFWLHNSYWFGAGGGSIRFAAQRLQTCLTRFAKQDPDPDDNTLLSEQIAAGCAALKSLTDWCAHATPVLEASKPALDHWPKAIEARRKHKP